MVDNVLKVVTKVAEEALGEVNEQSFNHFGESLFHVSKCRVYLVSFQATVEKMRRSLLKVVIFFLIINWTI